MHRILSKIVAVLIVFYSSSFGFINLAQAQEPTGCDTYEQPLINGNVFLDYERIDYPNGRLAFHFQLNPQNPASFLALDMRVNIQEPIHCQKAADTWPFFQMLPISGTAFSIRFVSDDTFQFYDDDTGLPVDCGHCRQTFIPPSPELGPAKAHVEMFSYQSPSHDNPSYYRSTSHFIVQQTPIRTPVLIVPGVIGTEIFRGQQLLWPDIAQMTDPLNTDDFMDPLGFNFDLTPQDETLTLGQVVRKPVWVFDYIQGLVEEFTSQGYAEGVDLFTLPYDWRFGVSHNIGFLKNKIENIKAQTGSQTVDVVAHSTGGLILKKHIMEQSDHSVNKAVFVGTPNLGAPKAAKVLLEGDSMNIPGLSSRKMKQLAQNMPVMYDLSPSAKYTEEIGSYLRSVKREMFWGTTKEDLTYDQSKQYMVDRGLNLLGFQEAEELHSDEFDGFDVRSQGVNAFNVIGCNSGTIGWILDRVSVPSLPFFKGHEVVYAPGDGTVPLRSAQMIPTDENKSFYVTDVGHAGLLSSNGPRQQIVNIMRGNLAQNPDDNVYPNDETCRLSGKKLGVFSPIDVEAIDEHGNRTGLLPDGSVQNDIPGASLDIMGEHKFLYLPDTQNRHYEVNLDGTGEGTATVALTEIWNNQEEYVRIHYDVPVTSESQGQLDVGNGFLQFDDKTYSPSVGTPGQINDEAPPEFSIQFDINQKNFVFQEFDNQQAGVIRTDGNNQVFLQDPAGNTTELVYEINKTDERNFVLKIVSLRYNDQAVELGEHQLSWRWTLDKDGKPQTVTQQWQSPTGKSVHAVFNGKETIITDGEQQGRSKISKMDGLAMLQLRTEKGNLYWSYTITPF